MDSGSWNWLAYFVEEKHYRNHLAQYGTQKEVSVLLSPPDTY